MFLFFLSTMVSANASVTAKDVFSARYSALSKQRSHTILIKKQTSVVFKKAI
jgi:hypothetical protein